MTKKKMPMLAPGKGIATTKAEHKIKFELTSGVVVLIYDLHGQSGGVIHALESEADLKGRIDRLTSVIKAKRPAAKIVGIGESTDIFVVALKKCLSECGIAIEAESIEVREKIGLSITPALGKLGYKRAIPTRASAKAEKVKVMIVDDAPVIRKLLREIIAQDTELELVGEADSAAKADELLKTVKPDVITLDIHMPVEDGVSFLGRLMKKKFIPVIIVSSLSMEESDKVFESLSLGAIDYVQKPAFNELEEVAALLCEKLKVAAKVKEKKQSPLLLNRKLGSKKATASRHSSFNSFDLVAVGASTGGVQALTEILVALPAEIPPIVIVQHIPPVFSRAFCDRLDKICQFSVKEAEDGDLVQPGVVLVAPGGKQMKVEKRKGKLVTAVYDGERVNRHKPSVEVLFKSVAKEVGAGALGVILTGMGEDGADGLLTMRKSGAHTIAQDEASCVVFGMPGAAVKIGAAERVLPLNQIGAEFVKRARKAG